MSSIRDYWINELKETVEFKAIADTEDVDFSVLEGNIKDLLDDQFISTATEYGIARREVLLKITPKAEDDLETRRDRVGFVWNNQLPYTYRKLEQQLDTIAEGQYTMVLNHGAYELTITIELISAGFEEAIREVAQEMVPVNMVLVVQLNYNTYNVLAGYTYDQLKSYTYEQLRTQILP